MEPPDDIKARLEEALGIPEAFIPLIVDKAMEPPDDSKELPAKEMGTLEA